MIAGLIPHRYAKALFKFASEHDNAEKVYEEMKCVISAFSSNPSLDKVMSNPYIVEEDKEKLLLSAVGSDPSDDYRRFVRLILEHKRESFAYLMALAYREIYRVRNNISQVKIQTAAQLPEREMDRLKNLVSSKFPDSKLEYTIAVNPDLIGGFVIDVDSARMDASVKGELEQLRQNLLSVN